MHKAAVTPRVQEPEHWSQMQISCEVDGWKSSKTSYVEQVADYQKHKNGKINPRNKYIHCNEKS